MSLIQCFFGKPFCVYRLRTAASKNYVHTSMYLHTHTVYTKLFKSENSILNATIPFWKDRSGWEVSTPQDLLWYPPKLSSPVLPSGNIDLSASAASVMWACSWPGPVAWVLNHEDSVSRNNFRETLYNGCSAVIDVPTQCKLSASFRIP